MDRNRVLADPFNLQRFTAAQDPVYEQVCQELRNGRKETHWMWFVFPQLRGLGKSATAYHFGLSSRAEAEAYWNHPTLGPRLVECDELVNAVENRTIEQIFGSIDAMKFRSSITLFAAIAPDTPVFRRALEKYFNGEADPITLARL